MKQNLHVLKTNMIARNAISLAGRLCENLSEKHLRIEAFEADYDGDIDVLWKAVNRVKGCVKGGEHSATRRQSKKEHMQWLLGIV